MTIAVHIAANKFSNLGHLAQFILHLAKVNKQDHYVVFADEILINNFPSGENITPVIISPSLKNSLSIYYWYNFKLPSYLKRYNAEIFISNFNVLSTKVSIPQFLFVEQIEFLQNGKYVLKSFIKKNIDKFILKAQIVFTTERYIRMILSKNYPSVNGKLQQLYFPAATYFQPVDWEKKEEHLQKISGGYDYFLFYLSQNTSHALRITLKAFSIFKKWQKSSMKLVLMQQNVDANELIKDLHLYKYRSDLVICNDISITEKATTVAAAYALLYCPNQLIGEEIIVQAMQCETPIICTAAAEEHVYESEILSVSLDENEIAKQMILLYKDEFLYKTQIQKSNSLLTLYDLKENANALRSVIGFKTVG